MKRIWAVGASVRALAQSLFAAGYGVLAADLFNDLDLRRIAATHRIVDYPHDLLRLVDAVEADAWIYTGGLENYPDLVDQLARRLPLLGNPSQVLRRVRDVPLLQQSLVRNGFHFPTIAKSPPDNGEERWLRKSSRSSGGLRVAWASPSDKPLHRDEYYQQFIDGPVYGTSFVATADGVQLLGVTRQLTNCPWTGAPEFLYAGSVGPVSLSDDVQAEVKRLGTLLVNEFKLRGWFGVDFVVDANGRLWVLEVNPRYTASIELLQCSSAAAHIAACKGQGLSDLPVSSTTTPVMGKAVCYTSRNSVVTPGISDWLFNQPDIADIPPPHTELPAKSPLVSLLARRSSEKDVLAKLQSRAEQVKSALNQ